ncbi:MAG: carboxypeptidase regulatory-like domain-containing protein [Gemmatimonadetes bacterium]|nr:carboxypeptidase regulatory-like domain-containing protein [Gemmatimonadota bacterium]
MRVAAVVALVAAALLRPTPIAGQTVLGRVLEEGSGIPVAGALVRWVGEDGGRGPGSLTSSEGRYRLELRTAVTGAIEIDRIGYATTRIAPVTVPAEGVVQRDIVLEARALVLEGLEIEGEGRRCDLREADGGRTQVVWSQVRTALEAATWTRREGGLLFRLRNWVRTYEPGSETPDDEQRRVVRSRGGNSVQALSIEQLEADGWVRRTDDGGAVYSGPDAETLLSDWFLENHCFALAAGGEAPGDPPEGARGAGWLGLSFDPVPGSGRPGLAGTVRVDRESARLLGLDFRYVDLPPELRAGDAGGSVEYATLPDGRWVVREWSIRAPVIGRYVEDTAFGDRDRFRLTSTRETGATVLWVEGPDFTWSASPSEAAVRGVVFDRATGSPLSGAWVRLAGQGWRTRTDAEGRFLLEGLPEGRFRLAVDAARLDSLGVDVGLDVDIVAGEAVEVRLEVPTPSVAARAPPEEEVRAARRPDSLPEVVPIEGVRVEVEGRDPTLLDVGFYERESGGVGITLDLDELRLESVSRLSESLERVPQIQRVDVSSGTLDTTRRYLQFRSAARSGFRNQSCVPALIVDGVSLRQGGPMSQGSGMVSLDELVDHDDVLAVELYDSPASMPIEFTGPGTLCGAIVVWTRRGSGRPL